MQDHGRELGCWRRCIPGREALWAVELPLQERLLRDFKLTHYRILEELVLEMRHKSPELGPIPGKGIGTEPSMLDQTRVRASLVAHKAILAQEWAYFCLSYL